MRVLVTGAAGRLGGAVAAKLKARGCVVTGVDRLAAPQAKLELDRWFTIDLAATTESAPDAKGGDAASLLGEAMHGIEAVVHCAAWPGPSATPPPAVVASGRSSPPVIGLEAILPAKLLKDNVGSTAALCDAAVKAGAKRFVFSSSAFAFGYSHVPAGPQAFVPQYLPIDENHQATPLESYGLSKLAGEQVLSAASRTALDCSFVSLRFTNIVKRERWSDLPWSAPTAAEPLTLLMWAYVHEDDVIDAHVAAVTDAATADKGTHELYVLSAPDTRFAQPTVPLLASTHGLERVRGADGLVGNASPLSAAKAERRLGIKFKSWQQPKRGVHIAASPSSPSPSPLPFSPAAGTPRHRSVPKWNGTRLFALLPTSPQPKPKLESDSASHPATVTTPTRRASTALIAATPVATVATATFTTATTCTAPSLNSVSLSGSGAAHRALSDPNLRFFPLHRFRLACGAELPASAHLAYRIYGPPAQESQGVILHPTSFDAVHDELEYQIGPGRTFDTNRYTVIVPNLLGNGVSFSPSTLSHTLSKEPAATDTGTDSATAATAAAASTPTDTCFFFPLVSVADNVRAQRAMLEAEGVSFPLKMIYGYSMGALQAYEWAVAHPNSTLSIAAVCGASKCGDLNAIFLRSLGAALQADSAWSDEKRRFVSPPTRGLRAFANIYAGWGVGAEWYLSRLYSAAGFFSADDFVERSYEPAFAGCDANDLLSQIRTWRAADVSVHAQGDWEAAMRRIRARVLLMPGDTDKYFTLTEAEKEAEVLGERCVLRPIRSGAGHRAGDPHRKELAGELQHIQRHVHELLSEI